MRTPSVPLRLTAACCLVALITALAPADTPPDRSVRFPPDWTSTTLVDSEQVAGWRPGHDEATLKERYVAFSVSHATEARARGRASCRWEVAPRTGETRPALLVADTGPITRCDAISLWLKNPEGHRALLGMTVEDAQGVRRSAPAVLVGEERNWYEIAFRIRDFVAEGEPGDARAPVAFPLRSIALALHDLAPGERHVFYVDELQIHRAPPARLDVIELSTPREAEAGADIPVRFRLRAQTPTPEGLMVQVGLRMGEVVVARETALLPVPAGGMAAGALVAPLETTLRTPPLAAPGDYHVTFAAEAAEIMLPPPDRLPTSRISIRREDDERTTSAVTAVRGRPTLIMRGEPPRLVAAVSDVDDGAQLAALERSGADLVRFRVALGDPQPGAAHVAWLGAEQYDFSALEDAVGRILAAAPDALLLPEVIATAPAAWRQANVLELAILETAAGERSRGRPSLSSPAWREDVSGAVGDLVQRLEEGPFADHIAGYQVSAGLEGRWLSWDVAAEGMGDYSEPQRYAFQDWLRERYGNLEALRLAWGQPARPAFDHADAVGAFMSWAEIELPSVARRRAARAWLLDPAAWAPVVDYRLFASHAVVEALGEMVRAVREATGREKVCGAAYGHFMELAARHKGLEQGGHLALGRALRGDTVDFLVGPPAAGRPGAVLMPAASVARRQKVLLPDLGGAAADPVESLAACLETAAPPCLPPGADLPDMGELPADLDLRSAAQIAVIVDDESAAHFGYANPVKRPLLTMQMEQVRRLGAPVDVWLLADALAGRIPRYRMYLFLNAFRVESHRAPHVMSSLGDGEGLFVWMCAPGLIGTTLSGRRMLDLTGISASVVSRAAPLMADIPAPRPPLIGDLVTPLSYGLEAAVAPQVEVIGPQGETLGVNREGKPALVARTRGPGVSVFSAAPNMPAALLRSFARAAGVHVYNQRDDRFYANRSLLALHAESAGVRVLELPEAADVYEYPGGAQVTRAGAEVVVNMPAGGVKVFIVRPRGVE